MESLRQNNSPITAMMMVMTMVMVPKKQLGSPNVSLHEISGNALRASGKKS